MNKKDPKSGLDLIQLENNIYMNEYTHQIYIYTSKDDLNNPEIEEKQQYYTNQASSIYIVVDEKLLEDPVCEGALLKTGENSFVGEYSFNNYILQDNQLLELREPIAGTELVADKNGKYFSETLGKFFTLEKTETGKNVFLPTYLPYSGMEDITAQFIDGKLVGENGINFSVDNNGYIDLPMEENLTTQNEIDQSVRKKNEINSSIIKRLESNVINKIDEYKSNDLNKNFELWQEAFDIAMQIEKTVIDIKNILDTINKNGENINISDLPQIPKMPNYIPLEIQNNAIDNAKNIFHQNEENLKFENIQNSLSNSTITKDDMYEAINNLNLGLNISLSQQKETEKNKNELEPEL